MLVGPDEGPTTAGAAGAAAAVAGYSTFIIGPALLIAAYLVRRRKQRT
jgi:hypothetical protein